MLQIIQIAETVARLRDEAGVSEYSDFMCVPSRRNRCTVCIHVQRALAREAIRVVHTDT